MLILATGLMLGGLGGCDKDDNGGGSGGNKVTGILGTKFADWEMVGVSFSGDVYGENPDWETTADVVNGKFTLTLPVPANKYLEDIDDEAPEGATITPSDAKWAYARFYLKKASQIGRIVLYYEGTTSYVVVSYMYVDKDMSITGTYSEEDDGDVFIFTYNAKLKKGWNAFIATYIEAKNGDYLCTVTANGNIPSGARWEAW